MRDDEVGGAGRGAQGAQGGGVQPARSEHGGGTGVGRVRVGVGVRGEGAQCGGLAAAAKLPVEVPGEVLGAAAARIGDQVQDAGAGSGRLRRHRVGHGNDLGTGPGAVQPLRATPWWPARPRGYSRSAPRDDTARRARRLCALLRAPGRPGRRGSVLADSLAGGGRHLRC